MIKTLRLISIVILGVVSAAGCSWQDTPRQEATEDGRESEPASSIVVMTPITGNDDPLWVRHHESSLKILSIGNSFTSNATAFLPYMFNKLNADSICIATLTYPGCSLRRHWANHIDNREVYSLMFSDNGEWKKSSLTTLDDAIRLLDWDIITFQQDSGNSGDYSTYQPHVENLTELCRSVNPDVTLAWHITWSYTPGCSYEEFSRYDYDWKKMYDAIVDAGAKVSVYFDITIDSADLIKDLRESFPEIQDGFSSDGRHVSHKTAQYALSKLWYELLVAPAAGVSSVGTGDLPTGVNVGIMNKADSIIVDILDNPIESEGNSVPMLQKST